MVERKPKIGRKIMRKAVIPLAFLVMAILFTACPGKEPVYVDLGRIPEQYLATVPYRNGDVFRMQHETSKVVIDFTVSRHRRKVTDEGYGPVPERFQPGPDYIYEFEVDNTVCKPNYPIFDVNIAFSNEFMRYAEEETPSMLKSANIYATGSARFPLFGEDASGCEMIDSLEVNGRYYHDVFKLEASYTPDFGYGDEEIEQIHVKSFLYNYGNGIIGILMSNGEKYWLYED